MEIQSAWRMHRLRSTIMQRLRQARWQRDARFQALQQVRGRITCACVLVCARVCLGGWAGACVYV